MRNRYIISAAVIAGMFTFTVPTQAQAPSTTEQIKTWSQKKWNQARIEFAKDKAKWSSCRQQSKNKNLRGRASWSFLYDCMKS